MASIAEVVESLRDILRATGSEREELVSRVQKVILNDTDLVLDAEAEGILVDLAVNMDYYEPNPEWRRHDPSYFDDARLEEYVKVGIRDIEQYLRSQQ